MSPTDQHQTSVVLPQYLQSLFAELREHSGFEVIHMSRKLDGLSSESLTHVFESHVLNNQSGYVINDVRITLRNPGSVVLNCTWGVFDEDESSADADDVPKPRFEHDIRLAGASDLPPILTALARAGFEGTQSTQPHVISFIRGQKRAGKMRLGIHVSLDYSARIPR